MLFRDRFCLDQLLRCYLCILRNVLMPVFRLTSSWSFRNHFVVPFPISIPSFSSVVCLICRFFLTISVEILPGTVLPEEWFYFSGRFKSSMALTVHSWLYIQSKPFHSVLEEFRLIFICSITGVFQFSQNMEQFLFVICSVSSCYYYNIV